MVNADYCSNRGATCIDFFAIHLFVLQLFLKELKGMKNREITSGTVYTVTQSPLYPSSSHSLYFSHMYYRCSSSPNHNVHALGAGSNATSACRIILRYSVAQCHMSRGTRCWQGVCVCACEMCACEVCVCMGVGVSVRCGSV